MIVKGAKMADTNLCKTTTCNACDRLLEFSTIKNSWGKGRFQGTLNCHAWLA